MTQSTLIRPSRRRREQSRPRQSLVGRARAGLAAAMGLALLASLVVVAVGHGYLATHPQMGTGSIWLPSDTGQLTLFDGSTVTPTFQVPLATGDAGLTAAEAGDTGYAVDQQKDLVWRISGNTLNNHPTPVKGLISAAKVSAADPLRVFATQTAFYAVGSVAVAASPSRLTTIGTFPTGTATTIAGHVVTDQDGRLWVLDPQSGNLTWFSGGQSHVRRGAVSSRTAAAAVLSATDGQPVIITPALDRAQLLNPATGTVQRTLPIPDLPAGNIVAAGSAGTPQVVIATGDRGGTAVICSFTTATCQRPLSLPYQGPVTLGQPVEAAGDVFIPGYTTNDVVIISLATGRIVHVAKNIVKQPGSFDLLTKDGIVFYNNPESNAAGVIRPNGTVIPGIKYSPTTPAKASLLPAPGGSATISPSPPATPTTNPKASAPASSLSTPTAGANSPAGFSSSPGIGPQPGSPSPAAGPLVITGLAVSPSQPMVGQPVTISVLYTGTAPASWTWMIGDHTLAPTQDQGTQTTFSTAGTYTITVSAGAARKSVSVTVSASAPPDAQCGETITTSLTLNTDLNCSGTGLIIDADNVTVDLNGHTVSGSGGSGTGIHLETTVASGTQAVNFTVKGGTITGFGQAMDDDGIAAAAVTISQMVINGGSVCGDSAEQCDIESSRVSGSPVGCGRNGKLTINNSIFSDSPVTNGPSCQLLAGGTAFDDAPVAIDESFDTGIDDCSFSSDGIGLETELGTNDNVVLLVTDSKFEDDSEAGIYVTVLRAGAVGFSSISKNTFSRDGSVAGVDGEGNPIQGGLHIDGVGGALPLPGVLGKFTVGGNQGSADQGFDIWTTPGVVTDVGGNTSDRGAAWCVNVTCAKP